MQKRECELQFRPPIFIEDIVEQLKSCPEEESPNDESPPSSQASSSYGDAQEIPKTQPEANKENFMSSNEIRARAD